MIFLLNNRSSDESLDLQNRSFDNFKVPENICAGVCYLLKSQTVGRNLIKNEFLCSYFLRILAKILVTLSDIERTHT